MMNAFPDAGMRGLLKRGFQASTRNILSAFWSAAFSQMGHKINGGA
jgi:hypothetical protein